MSKEENNLFCLNQLKILRFLIKNKESNINQICVELNKQQQEIDPYLDSLVDYDLIIIEQIPKGNVSRYKITIPKESLKDVKTLIKIFSKKNK